MAKIVPNGISQKDLVSFLTTVVALVNELKTEMALIETTLASVKAIYDAHTHECPGSSYAASRSSTPDTGAAENSLAASVASAVTDSSSAISTSDLTLTQ